MKKFRKLLSVVLSIAMIMTMTTVLLPNAAMAANVKMGVVGDGSSNYTISLFNNYQNAVVEHDVPGTAGKAADDVFYRITRTEDPVGGEANTGIAENFGFTYGKKALMSFDVMFSSPNAQFCFGYGASVENATGSGQGTFTNLYVMSIGTAFGLKKQSGMASIPDNAPTSLSSNQWHNIAIEVLNDGTPAINVYIDGEKYACQLTANSWGVRHGRISISAGTVCLDNYYYNLDTAYDNTLYKVNDITVTPTEKFEYNAETKEFKILADDLTVAELKTAFSTEYDMDIYEDASYQTLLSDSDYVTQTSVLVVKNGNGAYRYYKAVRENNSLFNIAENGDGVSCTVTGLKEKLAANSLATIEIPEKIAGYTVTAIGTGAFKEATENYKSIASVTLPNTIKTIGDSAFYDCYGLSSINFPEGLETIGASAFIHVGGITGAFPSTLKKIGSNAFEYSGVKNVALNDGLTSVGAWAFHWAGGVSEAIFPDSLTYLGDGSLMTGTGLTKVRFPRNETFTAIPANTFDVNYPADSTKNTLFGSMSIYIPENITTIPANMLKHFKDGAAVKIYGSLESEAYNFYETTKAAIDAGTYTNERGGKIGSLTFIDYDFETDTENVVNDSGYNKGDTKIALGTQEATTTVTIGAPGVGGKTEDDVVIKLDTLGGDGGHNFVNLDGYKSKELVQEFSICTPSAGKTVRVQLGYWTTEACADPNFWNNDILEVTSGGIRSSSFVGGTMLCEAGSGEWQHIVVIIPADKSTELKVYINGELNTLTLPSACYGTRHFRIYPVKASETFNVYYDNIRSYTSETLKYNPKWDMKAEVTSTDSEIRVFDGEGIMVDKSVTAGELKAALNTNIAARANIRVYQDSSFAKLLADDETVPDLAVVVVAATNGASIEKSYAYYAVNPPINDTFYNITVNSDGTTATVTGFNRDRITETDDLSAIAIPETIAGYTITAIGSNAFKDETEIQSVVLPDTVESIGSNAFAGSQVGTSASGNLTSVVLPKNLKSIGSYAFAWNMRLNYIDLPDGLESIGNNAFYWSGLKSISVPDSVTSMGSAVFRLCASLEYAKLSAGVTTIPAETFYSGSSVLKEIVIPETVTGAANTDFINDTAIDPIIYGVYGSWAETFANEHGYEFVNVVANTIVASRAFMGDGTKEIAGTSYDLKYGYEKIYFNGNLINIGQTDTKATVILAMYDETGKMVERNSLDVTIPASQTVEISNENNLYISGAKLKDGYTLKNFVWRKSNNEPISAAYVINMDETKKEIHVLSIANSFCNDSFGYLVGICKADGVTIKAQNMYIGGAKITQHFNNMYGNLPAYQPVINMNYGENGMRMKDALESDKWDFVALQAATHGANSNDFAFLDYETYNHTVTDNGSTKTFTTGEIYEYIRDYVAQYAPTATRMMHMSWGPNDSQSRLMYNGRFADAGEYPAARMAVYNAQKQAYKYAASIYSTEDYMLVPTSEAVQYAINTLGFAEQVEDANPDDQYYDSSARALYRDTTCHLTIPYGRVLVGLTWYEYLTGNDVTQNPYQISGISAEDMALLKQAAHYACTMAEYNPAQ